MKYFIAIFIIAITALILMKPETKVMTYEGQVNASQLQGQLIVK